MYTLKNKLLISMPNMTDPYFAKSVIFICEYNNDGAIGFIINKPVNTMKIISSGIKDKFFKDLLSQSKKSILVVLFLFTKHVFLAIKIQKTHYLICQKKSNYLMTWN